MQEQKKLHLGCGPIILPGWINCDLYDPAAQVKCDVAKLPFEGNYADEIYASHIIEHFHYYEAFDVLREWLRVLKPGGKLMIETPDMLASCKQFVMGNEQDRINLYGHFFAQPWLGPGQVHKMLYTENQLRWTLECCGFKNMKRVEAKRYIGNESRNLGMEAFKEELPKSTALSVTQILSFEIGSDCNLAIAHTGKCPNAVMDRTGRILTDDQIILSVTEAYSLGFEGYISWSFYNEPMLHYKRMFGLMEVIRDKFPKSRFLLWTNGTILVEDERMKMFETIFVTNYNDVPMETLRKHFSPTVVSIASIRDKAGHPLLDDRLHHYTESSKKRCTLPFDNLVISNTGEAFICCVDWQNEIKIGNVFTSSLKEIDARRFEIIKKISGKEMTDDAPNACVSCAFKWETCHFDGRIRQKALEVVNKIEEGLV